MRALAAPALAVVVSGAVVVLGAARVIDPPAALEEPAIVSAKIAPEPGGGGAAPAVPSRAASSDDGAEADCAIPDRGAGNYGEWQTLPIGRMRAPVPAPSGEYDVWLHFHGGGAATRVVAPMSLGVVIATVDVGVGSQAYAEAFAGGEPLGELLATVSAALAPARARHLVLSSWSAGYGAVREILRELPTVPSALVLLDSVHTGYEVDGETLEDAALAPFLAYAQRAASGEASMVLTHSEIRPPGYASTSEVAGALLEGLGLRRRYAGLVRTFGVEAKTEARKGRLVVRGYTGSGKEAHCAHLRMLEPILRDEVLPALAVGDESPR